VARNKAKPRRRAGTWFKRLALAVLVALGIGLGYEIAVFPNLARLQKDKPPETAFMRYRRREAEAAQRPYTLRWTWVPMARISAHLRRAVLVAEDDRFYEHEGFDVEALQGALEENLREGRYVRGGSTISQQLAKNLYLSPRKSILRKLHETLYTWALERRLAKERILEIYLNVVEWGDGIFGAEAAARAHFGIAAADLSAEQAAALAACLPSPLKRDPAHLTPRMARYMRRILHRMAARQALESR